jgi:uncharacterized membrane protein YkvA (DUF1232 family)
MKEKLDKYIKKFSSKKYLKLIRFNPGKIGSKALYTSLLLFYAFKRSETPSWAKNIILGTLGYLVSPIDLVPDLTPVLGYTDDLGMLSFGLVTIASFINKEVKEKAINSLNNWFPKWDKDVTIEVDKIL